MTVDFRLNGVAVSVSDDSSSLLEALRDHLGVTSAKDGCSPQGQCGCCTVWVDGQARVACVTPVARVADRAVTTIEGISEAATWGARLCDSGGSQCGFCTPGIVMRVAAIPAEARTESAVRSALLAHLCRCTGWNSVVDAVVGPQSVVSGRDLDAAAARARLEGGETQLVSPAVALGRGGFASDTAPPDALVAVLGVDGEWIVAESSAAARRASGKVQGRRTTEPMRWPLDVPSGDWSRTLQTTWVEPAYLEPDAAWCAPGADPVGPLSNGGAFGGKRHGEVGEVARALATRHGRPVLAMYTREDVVRRGAKRPPLAAGVRADGSGVVRVARTAGIADAIRSVAPGLEVEEVDVAGPPTSVDIRGAGWVEAAVLIAGEDGHITAPNGATAQATIAADGSVTVRVSCGDPLDEVVLRSYCIGAAHMALGWVRSEGLRVDAAGVPLDLTIRSFGVIRAVDTPTVRVIVESTDGPSVNGSDVVFAAVASAAWRATGHARRWPTMRA